MAVNSGWNFLWKSPDSNSVFPFKNQAASRGRNPDQIGRYYKNWMGSSVCVNEGLLGASRGLTGRVTDDQWPLTIDHVREIEGNGSRMITARAGILKSEASRLRQGVWMKVQQTSYLDFIARRWCEFIWCQKKCAEFWKIIMIANLKSYIRLIAVVNLKTSKR